ncbi:monocarboxylate transporter 12 [Dermatophagoides farinae]|uniref:monocarboxylate transporter 12 n=1 Tax=Dermatophagoides farinae TaxID=6954 RepID=UPI003F5D9434
MSLNSIRLLYLETLYSSRTYSSLSSSDSFLNRDSPKIDGQFGWIVVMSSLFISVLDDGYAYTCGQFYEQFLAIYGQTETITSIFISIMNGTIYGISPFASGLIKVYGCRTVSIIGSIMAITGMLLSTIFDQSIYFHFITIGLLAGCGLGLLFITQLVIITVWFDRKLALATGIAECGSGFGMAIFAFISDYFIQMYTWKGAMIILAGFVSTCLVFSGLYAEPDCPSLTTSSKQALNSKSLFCQVLEETADFSLLWTRKSFLLFVLSQFILNLVFFTPVIIITDRIRRAGFGSTGASIYCCFGIANGFGRILFGFISTSFDVNNLWLFIVVTIALGATVWLTNLAYTLVTMQLFYALIGIFFGANVCLTPVVLVDMLGTNKMANAYGIVSFFDGLAALIGPPILNLTVNNNDGNNDIYSTSILITGLVSICSVLFLIPITWLHDDHHHNEEAKMIYKNNNKKQAGIEDFCFH